MLNLKLVRNIALAALTLGVAFIAGYFFFYDSHRTFAKLLFILGALCDAAFAVTVIVWVYIKTWLHESQPPMPQPGVFGGQPGMRPPLPPGAVLGGEPGPRPAAPPPPQPKP